LRRQERQGQLAQKRNVDFFLARSPGKLEEDIRESFKVLKGRLPTQEEIREACAWQILENHRLAEFSCETMSRLEPQWKIIRLNGAIEAAEKHD
jgi:hypothetical protein